MRWRSESSALGVSASSPSNVSNSPTVLFMYCCNFALSVAGWSSPTSVGNTTFKFSLIVGTLPTSELKRGTFIVRHRGPDPSISGSRSDQTSPMRLIRTVPRAVLEFPRTRLSRFGARLHHRPRDRDPYDQADCQDDNAGGPCPRELVVARRLDAAIRQRSAARPLCGGTLAPTFVRSRC